MKFRAIKIELHKAYQYNEHIYAVQRSHRYADEPDWLHTNNFHGWWHIVSLLFSRLLLGYGRQHVHSF